MGVLNYIRDYTKIWYLAARPKTWSASVAPVLVAVALAYSKGVVNVPISLLCLGVALFAQIASNYANDYFDFIKGADTEERTGPDRAVAKGWVSPKSVLIASIVSLSLAVCCGVAVVVMTKWWLILVGIAVAIAVYGYSAGPYPLAYRGLGDIAVMLFYGIVPVCGTIIAITGDITLRGFLLSLSMGFVSTNILVVNNYRDYENDMAANKRTSIVMYGQGFGTMLYIFCAAMALISGVLALCITDSVGETLVGRTDIFMQSVGYVKESISEIFRSQKFWLVVFVIEFALLQFIAWRRLQIRQGKELNDVLAMTSRNVLIWAIFLVILLVM